MTTTAQEAQTSLLMKTQVDLNVNYDPLDKFIAPAYDALMEYFTHNPEFLNRNKSYSFDKGLFLFGNIGCGKTLMMKMFSKNLKANYKVINCRHIASDFAMSGDESLSKYVEIQPANFYNKKPSLLGVCFDDIGTEPDKKYFGMDVNVILEVMLRRYDRGDFFRTHATTNLTPDEIKTRYGERLISRFREMFNLITFHADSIDKRK